MLANTKFRCAYRTTSRCLGALYLFLAWLMSSVMIVNALSRRLVVSSRHTLAGGIVSLARSSALVLDLEARVVRCASSQNGPIIIVVRSASCVPLFLMVLVCSAERTQVSTLQPCTTCMIEALCSDLQPGPHLRAPQPLRNVRGQADVFAPNTIFVVRVTTRATAGSPLYRVIM
jgi:hypothetical protein